PRLGRDLEGNRNLCRGVWPHRIGAQGGGGATARGPKARNAELTTAKPRCGSTKNWHFRRHPSTPSFSFVSSNITVPPPRCTSLPTSTPMSAMTFSTGMPTSRLIYSLGSESHPSESSDESTEPLVYFSFVDPTACFKSFLL